MSGGAAPVGSARRARRSGLAGPGEGCEHGAVTSLPSAAVDAPPAAPAVERSAADVFVRRLLRVDERQPRLGEEELRRGFSQSMVVSGIRCVITYLLIPFVGPILGVAAGVGPLIGLPIGALAIVFNVKSMRRFWRADHRYRWHYTAIGGLVVAMLVVLVVRDVVELIG